MTDPTDDPQQMPLWPEEPATPEQPATAQRSPIEPPPKALKSLDQLRKEAQMKAASRRKGGQVTEVLKRLHQTSNQAPLAQLLAEGFPDDAIAEATQDDPDDGRKKQKAVIEVLGGVEIVYITPPGLTAIGQNPRRYRPPTSESVAHANAPTQVADWLDTTLEKWPALPRVRVVTGDPVKAFSAEVVSQAWGRIQGAGDTTGYYSTLTGGLEPDALLIEKWRDLSLYQHAWGEQPSSPEDAAERLLGLEVELTAKTAGALGFKIRKWAACLDLGVAAAVVWVVASREIAEDLRALGVGGRPHPRQFLVPAHDLAMKGDDLSDIVPATAWWPLRIHAEASR